MKESGLEIEMSWIVEKLKGQEVNAPAKKEVFGFIFKRLAVIYVIQIVALGMDYAMYSGDESRFTGVLIISSSVNVVFSCVFFCFTVPVCWFVSFHWTGDN